jgi:hypothetical protein
LAVETVTADVPYGRELKAIVVASDVMQQRRRPADNIDFGLGPSFDALIRRCCEYDASQRPDFQEINSALSDLS